MGCFPFCVRTHSLIQCTAYSKKWCILERITVMGDDRLVYSLKDGTEITIEL